MSESRPSFRPGRQITESEGDEAILSGDPERIVHALIDGSRCLDDAWAMRHAWALTAHPDPGVRWAAVFAIDQARSTWVPSLVDDFEPVHVLDRLATNDPDASVRAMVATTMTDVISMLVSAQRPHAEAEPLSWPTGGSEMHLSADVINAEVQEDDYPNSVAFRDTAADYWVVLSRFSDTSPDQGTINVMVRDQIHTETANVSLELSRSRCRLRLDEKAASELLGVRDYTIDFQADDATYRKIEELLKVIFDGLPGLNVIEDKSRRTNG